MNIDLILYLLGDLFCFLDTYEDNDSPYLRIVSFAHTGTDTLSDFFFGNGGSFSMLIDPDDEER